MRVDSRPSRYETETPSTFLIRLFISFRKKYLWPEKYSCIEMDELNEQNLENLSLHWVSEILEVNIYET